MNIASLPDNASFLERVIYFLLLLCVGCVLYISTLLIPSVSGFGTHTLNNLGGECLMIRTFNAPCPFCGMTTSFTNISHFHFIKAVEANLFGPLLYAAFILSIPFLIAGILYKKRVYLYAFSERFNLWLDFSLSILAISYSYKLLLHILLFM